MRKLLFIFALMLGVTFTSCGNKADSKTESVDSVLVDTTLADTVLQDSDTISVDTLNV